MDEREIHKRLIKNDLLFHKIHVVSAIYDIEPSDKEHMGAYIEYQDLYELRDEFIDELANSIVDWVYSSEKYKKLKESAINEGRSESSACQAVYKKAKDKFRIIDKNGDLLVQGQVGELLLFHFIQEQMEAVPLLRKMPITTSNNHERYGADAIHYKVSNGKNIIVLGEAKTYTSKYSFKQAFSESISSILSTYQNHRKEIRQYLHEDFLDKEMNDIAEKYICNTLDSVEIHLVCVITYNETEKIKKENEGMIRSQIEDAISKRYASIDKSLIDIKNNPILARITYIIFPVWDLDELLKVFVNYM